MDGYQRVRGVRCREGEMGWIELFMGRGGGEGGDGQFRWFLLANTR